MRSKTSCLHSSERKFQGFLAGVSLNARYGSWELLRAGKGRCMQKSLYFKDSFFSHHIVSTASRREDIGDMHTNVPTNCPSILILRSMAQSACQYDLWFSRNDHFVTSCPIFIFGSRNRLKRDRRKTQFACPKPITWCTIKQPSSVELNSPSNAPGFSSIRLIITEIWPKNGSKVASQTYTRQCRV